MDLSFFNLVQIILTSILVVYGIYFLYFEFFNRNYEPLIWKEALKSELISKDLFKTSKKYKDKERFFNFWYQVERLKENNIKGAYAELGVYKGETANILHLMDPNREFHLFDTFEGFPNIDLKNETGKAATYTKHNFADTSVETVTSLFNSSKIHFHKGYFPDTTDKLDSISYALVNMDVDLYKPTKEGLEYFYPLMEKGGIILIHDHNPDWPGLMKAVKEFSSQIPEAFIQLTDKDSTIILIKS